MQEVREHGVGYTVTVPHLQPAAALCKYTYQLI